jgi:hypothetical protein
MDRTGEGRGNGRGWCEGAREQGGGGDTEWEDRVGGSAGAARTGSGKTLAFLIPAVELLTKASPAQANHCLDAPRCTALRCV